jgi:hypothetical protein
MTLETFERQVMAGLLAGDDPVLKTLREQYAVATVRDRERTASGFVTRFEVPASAPLVARKLLHLDDLQIELEGVGTPMDASVHVHNGRLRSLECFVDEGAYPEEPAVRAAWFYGTAKYPGITPDLLAERDVEELLEEQDE